MTEPFAKFENGPLTGLRILELGSTVAGPFCGRLLADFGAEVIKVEAADGDTVRTMGKHHEGRSLYAASIFRNKALISVDLRRKEGQEVIRKIARSCDVVVENFRPGALERWNVGYADLSAINPKLIMVRISGFGQTGPYAERPGYGVIGEALSGLRHITGDPDRPPARAAVSLTDYITGLYGAFGAVMAILVQRQTGRGQYIDAALYEAAFSFMEPHIMAYEKLGHIANRAGSGLPDNVPNNLYPSRDGAFIHIAAVGDSVFRRFADAIGEPRLADDPRFRTGIDRARHGSELDALIKNWTSKRDLEQLEQVLHAADVPAMRIYTMADIFRDPHYAARGMLIDVEEPGGGTVKMANVVPRLSRTPGHVRHTGASRVGTDTRRVLHDVAGLSPVEIEALEQSGAIICAPERDEVHAG